jgi:hypothetical protein
MIPPQILYEDRELTVRRIERYEKDLIICKERKDEWIAIERELQEQLEKEKESLNDIDRSAVKLYGKHAAMNEGFAI